MRTTTLFATLALASGEWRGEVTPKEVTFKEWDSKKHTVIIDVRSRAKYEEGHVEGAFHIGDVRGCDDDGVTTVYYCDTTRAALYQANTNADRLSAVEAWASFEDLAAAGVPTEAGKSKRAAHPACAKLWTTPDAYCPPDCHSCACNKKGGSSNCWWQIMLMALGGLVLVTVVCSAVLCLVKRGDRRTAEATEADAVAKKLEKMEKAGTEVTAADTEPSA